MKRLLCLCAVLFLTLEAFAEKPFAVNFGGRIRSQNSFERLIAESLCESEKCAGLRSAALFESIRDGSAEEIPVFRVGRATAAEILHLDPTRRNFFRKDFDASRSLLRQYAERDDAHPLTREFVRLDAAVSLYDSLRSKTFLERIGVDSLSLSQTELRQVRAESLYLKTNLPFWAWILSVSAFVLALFSVKNAKFRKPAVMLELAVSALCVAIFALRAAVENRLPVTSLFEMLLLLVLGLSLLFSILSLRTRVRGFLVCGSGISALLLFLMRNAISGDSFGAVSMLLNSPFWLSLHVFTIACGFSLLLVSGITAHVSLVCRSLGKPTKPGVQAVLWKTLHAGFFFSALGILFGGFWADVAWGRFWGWDPKENGALFVMLWILIVMHLKWGRLVQPKTLDVMLSMLAMCVVTCLLGVNLLGVGLHSYGYSPGLLVAFFAYLAFDAVFIAFFSLKKGNASQTRNFNDAEVLK